MTDLATIRIPVDSSDMLQAVKDSKSLERGIKMLVDSFDSGAISSKQFKSGLSQLRKEFSDLFTSYQQATSRVRGFASALLESKSATDAATASKKALTAATQKAETAFALANQKAKEELQLNRARADFAIAMGIQRAREADIAVAAADKQAQAEARLTQEILKRRNAQEQAAAQKAQNFQSQIGGNLGLGAQGISAGASASTLEGELERLKTKYDSTYAASKLFEAQSKELSFAMLNQAGNADTLKNEMDKLQAEYAAFGKGTASVTNRFVQQAAAVDQSRRGVNNWSLLVQQSGYQAGDFLVQIQSGTNAFVAFGQQATQLVGILPLFAKELGLSAVALGGITLGLSIAIPLLTALGAYLMRTSDASKKSSEDLSDLDSAIKSIDRSLKSWLQTKQAAAQGVTVEEMFGGTNLANAQKELETAQKALDKFNEQKAMSTGSVGVGFANFVIGSQKESDLAAAEQAVIEATKRVSDLQAMQDEKRSKAFKEQFNLLQEDLNMQIAIAKFGSDSAEVKNLELQQSLDQYNRQIDAQIESKEITAEQGLGLKYINQTLQDNLRIAQSAAVIANNQRSTDAARAQERLAAEAEYQSRVNEALAKNQYWSNQAKAAERQQAAVQYIMENLSLLAAKEDSEGFNKAMESALAAGVHFSQVDLSSVVAMAAKNGWSLVGALRAAWAAAQAGPVVNANPSAGPAFEGGGRMGNTSAPYIAPAPTLDEIIKKYSSTGSSGGGSGGGSRAADIKKEIELTKELTQAEKDRQTILSSINSSLENGFMAMIEGTKSVKEAFRSMAYDIIKELYRVLVVQRMVSGISGAVGLFTGPATGSFGLPFGGARASGGPVDPSKAYLVGEKGPELVIPRSSGTVVNANQTAKAMGGGGSNAVTVNNNITVTGSDAAMVRTEVAKMIPQITNATKAAVIDARLRGGQMKQAFR